MEKDFKLNILDKTEKYKIFIEELSSLISGESDETAILANTSAALHQAFNFFWVGFYMIRQGELLIAPFQGPVACWRIARGRGVCGAAWEREEAILVRDVELFPGHIACSSESRSEVVIPLKKEGTIIGVLDVDSDVVDNFDEIDVLYLQKVCDLIVANIR